MGSISRMNRCGRFRQQLEDRIVAKSPLQTGDWLEVVGVSVGQAEDGTEVSKLYVTVRNKRTGDEDSLTWDECLYDPEGDDEGNVDRLHGHLYGYAKDDEELDAHRVEVIGLLKKAELISSTYKEKT